MTIYDEGFGFANVDNLVPVRSDSVFRIASISKCFTSLLVGRLLEQQKLALDDDIRTLVPEFPEKRVNGSHAKITIRSLLNHTSGIRSYHKTIEGMKGEYPEMLLQNRYDTSLEACALFQNDALTHAPSERYTYSTFAFTLLSAVIEAACAKAGPIFPGPPTSRQKGAIDKVPPKQEISKHIRLDAQLKRLFTQMGLGHTFLEYPERVTPFLVSQYRRNKKGVLEKTPTVDNSYKWAGGGIVSTAPDLLRFANHLLSIYSESHRDTNPTNEGAVIRHQTLRQLWTVSASNPDSRWQPGLGWFLSRRSGSAPDKHFDGPDRLYVTHSGGALGGTTMLLMSLPTNQAQHRLSYSQVAVDGIPLGDANSQAAQLPPIAVVVLTNLEGASEIADLAIRLAEIATDCALEVVTHIAKRID